VIRSGDSSRITEREDVTLTADSVDETALVEQIARGDGAALRGLYDRCAARAMALARRILSDPQEAEEVVQETFVQVWRQASRFDAARGSPAAWVATIARSRAIDRLRARHAGDRVRTAAELEDPANEGISRAAGEIAEERELKRRVDAALQALPVEQRRTLELAYFEGLSQSQIAERLGDPLGTVKTRVRLGLSRLATLLGDTGVGS
jgi:RNA polymerase sigma-70 factor (ECF subfamily)